jgi:siroheme synthase
VGKAPRHHRMTQDDINALLVERGLAGQTVVRLKGGDPFVFARGSEEAHALAAAGVPYEVVPGITSALAVPAYGRHPRHPAVLVDVVHGGHRSRGPVQRRRHRRLGARWPTPVARS